MALDLLRARHVLPMVALFLVVLLGLYGPAAAYDGGRTYRVVYVAPDDVLNIRSGPSVGYAVVGMIPPGARGVRLVGHCREWCPVTYNGASGWVNPLYLAAEPATAALPEEPAAAARAFGYVAMEPPTARRRARLPSHWQVTGVTEGESLKVHEAPSSTASVVHAFEPQTGCIKLAGACQKPWCQVKFPGLSGDRLGWVDSKHLAPSNTACGN